jgi:hypothetical protein
MKGTLLFASMALTFLLASGAALAFNTIRCDGGECNGTPNDDKMVGSDRRDILYAFRVVTCFSAMVVGTTSTASEATTAFGEETAATSSGAVPIKMSSTAMVARTF